MDVGKFTMGDGEKSREFKHPMGTKLYKDL